ncbi:MAG: hypothetical protein MHM6MM_006249 [Cercozoa sp. M6MM]
MSLLLVRNGERGGVDRTSQQLLLPVQRGVHVLRFGSPRISPSPDRSAPAGRGDCARRTPQRVATRRGFRKRKGTCAKKGKEEAPSQCNASKEQSSEGSNSYSGSRYAVAAGRETRSRPAYLAESADRQGKLRADIAAICNEEPSHWSRRYRHAGQGGTKTKKETRSLQQIDPGVHMLLASLDEKDQEQKRVQHEKQRAHFEQWRKETQQKSQPRQQEPERRRCDPAPESSRHFASKIDPRAALRERLRKRCAEAALTSRLAEKQLEQRIKNTLSRKIAVIYDSLADALGPITCANARRLVDSLFRFDARLLRQSFPNSNPNYVLDQGEFCAWVTSHELQQCEKMHTAWRKFGVRASDYLTNVCGNFELLEFISNSKSGQYFFYSHDKQFMIKTQTKSESKFLRALLPSYFEYVMNEPNTLLTRFFGLHRVTLRGRTLYFIVMHSVFDTDRIIHETYDLKGSTHGRSARDSETVFKDLDFLDRGLHLRIGRERGACFVDQLARDVSFLASHGIMDYSLLVGIHYPSRVSVDDGHACARPSELERPSLSQQSACPVDDAMQSERVPQPHFGLKKRYHTTAVMDTGVKAPPMSLALGDSGQDDDSGDGRGSDAEESQAPAVVDTTVSIFKIDDGGIRACRSESGSTDDADRSGRDGRIYFVGIIDILQRYNAIKKVEHFAKGLGNTNRSSISAVPPGYYAARLLEFIAARVV